VLRKVSDRDEAALVAFDPDRPAVEAARRDPGRFETLYRRYVAQIYSFAVYQLADHHAAEDLTEQVFLQAMSALPRFHEVPRATGASSFRSWLFQIARHLASNERRSARRHPTAPLEAAFGAAGPEDPALAAARRDEAARAWRAVDRLPADRRTAVILRFVDERSIPEIAAVLGRSEGAVRVLLHRALRSVADDLREPGSGAGAR
jgi:RNA polymerase sigma-70 factor, ECF subfamily